MCGFLGVISKENIDQDKLINANNLQICRGPDSTKLIKGKLKNGLNYAFIFNRLSIIDLDEKAMQPMVSTNLEHVLMFNGEIYNHRDLRKELESKSVHFKTSHSDTEVILNGLINNGDNYIKKLNGQFSISFLNQKLNSLLLVRDRLGQKPMFYFRDTKQIYFGTNLRALQSCLHKEINEQSIYNYLSLDVVPSPETIYKDIYKLKPSQIMEIDLDTFNIKSDERFWKIEEFNGDKKISYDDFLSVFSNSVSERLEADVPVGTFLSGGLDSTSIVNQISNIGEQINSFSMITDEKKYNEEYWSDEVSKKYKTNHKKVIVSSNISNSTVLDSIRIFDEPYSDPSTVPSYLLSKLISEHYKVAISGDGGDELLGGYNRISQIINSRGSKFSNFVNPLFNLYPSSFGTGNKILKNHKNSQNSLASYHEDKKFAKLLNINPSKDYRTQFTGDYELYNMLMFSEYNFFLSEKMLLKVDRTSMANSLEVRSPFVDHRLIELFLNSNYLKANYKNPKIFLKNSLKNNFSEPFFNRPKQGFVFNLESWIYSNLNFIFEFVGDSVYLDESQIKHLKNMSIIKTRINANRLWKVFFLEVFLRNKL
ncbi:MAG: asparagine synthase (glutamine-hydrolyzing) [Gammaproteobacteria bacterium]|nr:asparagine synthase (glutamine-hydrolyzing) [Gammaproteobacteria bacterium]|tara:strand:+ start:842 stop:2626 length:1785 start_codon:yes stop_codon:yes gene_type:complete